MKFLICKTKLLLYFSLVYYFIQNISASTVGNCILTTDAQIDGLYTQTVTITSGVSECKALCKTKGTDCTGYWVNEALN